MIKQFKQLFMSTCIFPGRFQPFHTGQLMVVQGMAQSCTKPIVVFLILKKVKKRFYKMSDEMLLVGKGLLETHITYLEIFKVQNIKMQQTIFQKRSNVADIILQTASGKIRIPCVNFDDAVKIYNHTLIKVETSQTAWM